MSTVEVKSSPTSRWMGGISAAVLAIGTGMLLNVGTVTAYVASGVLLVGLVTVPPAYLRSVTLADGKLLVPAFGRRRRVCLHSESRFDATDYAWFKIRGFVPTITQGDHTIRLRSLVSEDWAEAQARIAPLREWRSNN